MAVSKCEAYDKPETFKSEASYENCGLQPRLFWGILSEWFVSWLSLPRSAAIHGPVSDDHFIKSSHRFTDKIQKIYHKKCWTNQKTYTYWIAFVFYEDKSKSLLNKI